MGAIKGENKMKYVLVIAMLLSCNAFAEENVNKHDLSVSLGVSDQSVDQLDRVLGMLEDRYGENFSLFYTSLRSKIQTNALIFIIIAVFFAIVSIVAIIVGIKWCKSVSKIEKNYDNGDKYILPGVIICVSLIAFIVVCGNIPNLISTFMFPDAVAVETLIKTIK